MTTNHASRVVAVTGGTAGVGRAAARAFAAAGDDVAVIARGAHALRATERELLDAGARCTVLQADAADPDQLDHAADLIESRLGPIDVWVNNAMVSVFSPVAQMEPNDYKRVTDVTYLGYVYGTMSALKRMRLRNRGVIVQVGSALAYRAIPLQSAYCAAKHGVIGLTKVAALDYAERGIRINAVCPGFIETPMVMDRGVKAGEDASVYQQLVDLHPIGRLGKPEEIAEAIVWMASEESSFVAGHPLVADGAYVAR